MDKTLDIVIAKYNECLNVTDGLCDIEWKHDQCRILREILFEATGDLKYVAPIMDWHLDPDALSHMQKIINTQLDDEVLNKIGSDYDADGIPYWEKWAEKSIDITLPNTIE
jgi:hypothetical protein